MSRSSPNLNPISELDAFGFKECPAKGLNSTERTFVLNLGKPNRLYPVRIEAGDSRPFPFYCRLTRHGIEFLSRRELLSQSSIELVEVIFVPPLIVRLPKSIRDGT